MSFIECKIIKKMLQNFRITVYNDDDLLYVLTRYNSSVTYVLAKEVFDKLDGSTVKDLHIHITYL